MDKLRAHKLANRRSILKWQSKLHILPKRTLFAIGLPSKLNLNCVVEALQRLQDRKYRWPSLTNWQIIFYNINVLNFDSNCCENDSLLNDVTYVGSRTRLAIPPARDLGLRLGPTSRATPRTWRVTSFNNKCIKLQKYKAVCVDFITALVFFIDRKTFIIISKFGIVKKLWHHF